MEMTLFEVFMKLVMFLKFKRCFLLKDAGKTGTRDFLVNLKFIYLPYKIPNSITRGAENSY